MIRNSFFSEFQIYMLTHSKFLLNPYNYTNTMTDLVLGIICVLYGVFTVIARIIKPEMFSKLNRMKEAYGEKAGYAIHLVSYSLIPIGTGAYLLYRYFISQE